MNKVLKLQRFGLMTPTVVEYKGKILATNQLDIDNICHLWRIHFCIYPEEEVDLVMTEKQFSAIQQKTLSSVKSVYELLYERNFIPRVFEPNEEPAEWGMYRNKEIEKLQAENAALRERLENAVELKAKVGDTIYLPWIYDGNFDIASLLITGIYFKNDEFHYITNLKSDSAIYLAKYEYGIFRNQDFDNIVFTDRIAAEARLAELKGERND